MKLDAFFPYRITVLAEAVSRSIAQVYESRFGLSRDEWRVLATLADTGALKPVELAEQTNLNKMQISRALKRMEDEGLVTREDDPTDGRAWLVSLQPAGRALHRRIVPMVAAREQYLLEELDDATRHTLEQAMDTVLARARKLTQQG